MAVSYSEVARDFEVTCTQCGWSGDVSATDLEDDLHEYDDGWDTNCVCPKCGGEVERD